MNYNSKHHSNQNYDYTSTSMEILNLTGGGNCHCKKILRN